MCRRWPGPCPGPAPSVPRQMLPPPTMTASSRSSDLATLGDLLGDPLDDRAVDGLVGGRRGERLARDLEHQPTAPACVNVYAGQARPTATSASLSRRRRPGRSAPPLPRRAPLRSSACRPWRRAARAGTRSLNKPFIRPSTIFASAARACPRCACGLLDGRPLLGDLGLRGPRRGGGTCGLAKAMWTAMSWASSAVPPRQLDEDAVHASSVLDVQVAVEDECPARPRSGRRGRRAMFSFRVDLQVVERPVALVDRLLARRRRPAAARSSTRSTNSADLATKSVSQRSSTTRRAPSADGDRDRALAVLAVGPLGRLAEALLAQPLRRLLAVAVGLFEAPAWRPSSRRRSPRAGLAHPWR